MSIRRPVNYKSIVPSGTFLHDFMQHMEGQETATVYDFWAGVWLLSCAVGRRVIVPRPRAPVFMNWYIVLAGESGVTRKTSAILAAKRVLEAAAFDDAVTINGKTTPEQLIELLRQQSDKTGSATANISVNEMISLLGKERYALGLPGLLTDLYDCVDNLHLGGTLARGEVRLQRPFVNLLTASTPTWLAKAINPDVIEGGFTSRTMFIAAERSKTRVAWPEEREDERVVGTLAASLRQIRSVGGRTPDLVVTAGGLKSFKDWYATRTFSKNSYLRSFESREDAHVLRLAGTLGINDGTWYIDAQKVKSAIRIIHECKEHGSLLFTLDAVANKVANAVDRLRSRLIRAGMEGVQQSMLYNHVRGYVTNEQFLTLLNIMHEMRMVQQFVDGGHIGRPSTIWRGTKLLAARNTIEQIMKEIDENA